MCIYDETRYSCGATDRHLLVPCSEQGACLEHIRWTDHRGEECDICLNTEQEATAFAFGTESLLTASTSSCAGSGYLWGNSRDSVPQGQRTPEHSERQNSDRPSPASNVSTASSSHRERNEGTSPPEHSPCLARESQQPLLKDVDSGDVTLDDEDRRELVEVDRASGTEEDVESQGHRSEDDDEMNSALVPWFVG